MGFTYLIVVVVVVAYFHWMCLLIFRVISTSYVSLRTFAMLRDKCLFVDGLGWVMTAEMLVD